jgi:hypothetical protein
MLSKKSSHPKIQQSDIIKKLSEPIIIEESRTKEPEKDDKLFGVIE